MGWRKTKYSGVWVRHRKGCPQAGDQEMRCRCKRSYRARRRNPVTGKPQWSRTYHELAHAQGWLAVGDAGAPAIRARAAAGPTFEALADDWWDGVSAGQIAKRRGHGGYSDTTLIGYDRSLRLVLRPEFGPRPAAEVVAEEWQMFVDRLARQGLSRSRIANHLAVVRAIYRWACRPTRQLVPADPTIGVELPPIPGKKRERVATAGEAEQLLAALSPRDRVPYAIAFYAGQRRAEIGRLEWADADLDGLWLRVRRAKSVAGTGRGMPMAAPLKPILRAEWMRQGQPKAGAVCPVSVTSNKLGERANRSWGWDRETTAEPWVAADAETLDRLGLEVPRKPITLHECRHTYASFLMAAGYTLRELMEYMGHASLQATEAYVKLLPQPGRQGAGERLNVYLERAAANA
jgi:integrase